MGVLRRMADARNTVEGKVLSVLMATLLVVSTFNVSAWAADKAEDTTSTDMTTEVNDKQEPAKAPEPEKPAAQPEQKAEPQKDATEEPKAETKEQPEQLQTPAQRPETEQPAAIPAPVEQKAADVALKLKIADATLTYGGRAVAKDATELVVPAGKDVRLTAKAADGFLLGEKAVKLVDAAGAESVIAPNAEGAYIIAADKVAAGATIVVSAEAVVAEEPEAPADEPATEPAEPTAPAEPATPATPEPATPTTPKPAEPQTPAAPTTEQPDILDKVGGIVDDIIGGFTGGSSTLSVLESGKGTENDPYVYTAFPGETIELEGKLKMGWQVTQGESYCQVKPVEEGMGFSSRALVTIKENAGGQTIKVTHGYEKQYFEIKVSSVPAATFNPNGAQGTSQTVNATRQSDGSFFISLPECSFTRSGYAFVGWSTDNDAEAGDSEVLAVGTKVKITRNTTYYAIWEKSAPTVTFKANGGIGEDKKTVATWGNVLERYAVTLPDPSSLGMSKEGSTFVGWSMQSNGKGNNYVANSEFVLTDGNSTTLYAIWLDDSAVATSGTTAYFYIRRDGVIQKEPHGYSGSDYYPTNAGKDLEGKVRQPVAVNNNLEAVQANLAVVPSDEQIKQVLRGYGVPFDPDTQYIQWYVIKARGNDWNVDGVIQDRSKYRVTYEANGGESSFVPGAVQYAEGETVQVDYGTGNSRPQRTGFIFLGWSEDSEATVPTYADGTSASFAMPNNDVTLYAVWRERGVVTYTYSPNPSAGGKVSLADESVNPEAGQTAGSTATANTGYKFDGWYIGETKIAADNAAGYNVQLSEDGKTLLPVKNSAGLYEGGAFEARFSKDESQTQETSYTVKYTIEGAEQAEDAITVEGTAWVNDAPAMIAIAEGGVPAPADKYEGYKLDESNPEYPAAGTEVASGTVYTVNYVADFTAIDAAPYMGVFDSVAHTPTVTGTIEGDVVSFSATPRDVTNGDAPVVITVTRGTETFTINSTVTITPRPVIVIANDSSKIYGDADPELTAATRAIEGNSNSGLIGSDAVVYTVSRATGEDAGEYVITAVGDTTQGNYSVTYVPATFTIAAADGNVVIADNIAGAEGLTKAYDGLPAAIEAEAARPGSTLLYSLDGVNFTTENPEFYNVGSYDVYVKATNPNYNDTPIVRTTLTVNPAAVTVTASNATKVAGAADPAFTATVSGLVNGESADLISYTVSRAAGEDVGVYAVTPAGAANQGNYAVTYVPGTLTITAAPVVPGPTTPTTPPTPVTPAPAGPAPAAAAVVPAAAAVVPAAAETIADDVTPLAYAGADDAVPEAIEDDATPMAAFDHPHCWVHYWIFLGIFLTLVYAIGVIARRMNYVRKIDKFEDDLTGGQATGDVRATKPVIGGMEA